ncbi:MAG: TraR/DksA family transcriptional regulator [Desulfohalobiaceae bacterium]
MLTEQLKAELYNKLFSRRLEILERTHSLKDQWQDVNVIPGDLLDRAQQEYVYLKLSRLDEQARQEVRIIDQALERMRSGEYGICESCGQEISAQRLQALPWATLCRACVQSMESESQAIPFEATDDKEQKLMTFWEPESKSDMENMSDEELLELVHERINADGRVETDELEISCEDGMLYLEGTLTDELQYNLLLGILQEILPMENIEESLRIETLVRMGSDEDEELEQQDETDEELLWREE